MEKEDIDETNTIWMKICFYIMSLRILFMLVGILLVPLNMQDLLTDCVRNMGFSSMGIGFLASYIAKWYVTYQWKGTMNPAYQIEEIRNENYKYLLFLATCVIPLVCMDFSNIRYVLILWILLVVMGMISVQMSLYYGNPTLFFCGYRLYRAKIKDENIKWDIMLITKDKIQAGDYIRWMKMEPDVWVVREAGK